MMIISKVVSPSQVVATDNTTPVNRISDRDRPSKHFDSSTQPKLLNEAEKTKEYWMEVGKQILNDQLSKDPNTKKAKNMILFLGDGMSHGTVGEFSFISYLNCFLTTSKLAATRMYLGGEEVKLSFEEFPYTANSKTYCVDKQVADSACTSTAYLTGVKAMGSTIGLNAQATRRNCADSMDTTKHTESIGSWAMNAGKEVGFVTTTRVTHASPTGLYGHIAYRHWENDLEVSANCDANVVDDIAEQLIHGDVGSKLKVVLGCGSRQFFNRTLTVHGIRGYRTDSKNLIEEWLAESNDRTYVDNKSDLMNLNPETVGQVIGLFDNSHCTYNLDVQAGDLQDEKPSLKEMTESAIDILSQNEEGFYLFVEGGRIE